MDKRLIYLAYLFSIGSMISTLYILSLAINGYRVSVGEPNLYIAIIEIILMLFSILIFAIDWLENTLK